MEAIFFVVALYALFLVAVAKSPGEVVQFVLAGVWLLMGLWALCSIAWALLSR